MLRKIKGILSLLLAFAIVLPMCPTELYAAPSKTNVAFQINKGYNLDGPMNGNTPKEGSDANAGNVVFQWNLHGDTPDARGQYVFRTVLENDMELFVFVSKYVVGGNPSVEVAYTIVDPQTVDPSGNLTIADLPAATAALPEVYLDLGGGTRGYVSYEDFRLAYGPTFDPTADRAGAYEVTAAGDYKMPTYILPNGTDNDGMGLATRYRGLDIKFVYKQLDRYDASFTLSINGMDRADIYDFELLYGNTAYKTSADIIQLANNGLNVGNANLFKGFLKSLKNVEFYPFANMNNEKLTPGAAQKPGTYLQRENGEDIDGNGTNNDNFVLDRRDIYGTGADKERGPDASPATEQNSLLYILTLPNRWNPVTRQFISVVYAEGGTADPWAGVQIGGNAVDNALLARFHVSKKHGLNEATREVGQFTLNESGTPLDNLNKPDDSEYFVKDGKGYLWIRELSQAEIYSVDIDAYMNALSIYSPLSTAVESAYTFLQYDVEYRNGSYYLSAEPYPVEEGTYSAWVGDKMTSSVYSEKGSEKPLFLPITLITDSNLGELIQIRFQPNTPPGETRPLGTIYSQYMLYKPDPDLAIIEAPQDLTAVATLTPLSEKDGTTNAQGQFVPTPQSDMELRLQFDIAFADQLRKALQKNGNMTLRYTLNKNATPLMETEKNQDVPFDGVEITLELDKNNKINASYRGVANGVYNSAVVEQTLYDLEMNYFTGGTDKKMLRADVTLKMRAGDVAVYPMLSPYEVVDGRILYFFYPNLYFIGVSRVVDATTNPPTVATSEYAPITLSYPDDARVPGAQSLRTVGAQTYTKGVNGAVIDEVSFLTKFEVPTKMIKDYLDKNYVWEEFADQIALTYNLYILQGGSEEYDRDTIAALKAIEDGKRPYSALVRTISYADALSLNPEDKDTIYFSDVEKEKGVKKGFTIDMGDTVPFGRDLLRKNQIICISDVPFEIVNYIYNVEPQTVTIKFDGLDKNQRYLVTADAQLNFVATYTDSDGVKTQDYVTKYPTLSNVAAILTKTDLAVPSPGENIPAMPNPIWEREEARSTKLTIHWDQIPSSDANGVANEYEIIRVKETPITPPDKLKIRNMTIGDYLKYELDVENSKVETIALKTNTKEPVWTVLEYDYKGKQFVRPATYTAFEATIEDGALWLDDNTVVPNSVYYYYVRTVQSIDGFVTYSPWNGVAATTRPVEGPIHLEIVRGNPLYPYNLLTETVIAFDAPISDLGQLGIDYDLYYSLKLSNKPWADDVKMDAKVLAESAVRLSDDMNGYYHFTYKISGLVSGAEYSVRVRMRDNANRDWSMFSNVVTTRTNLDQGEYDNKKETDSWLDYVGERLEELIKRPIYYTQDTKSELDGIYRPTMINGVLSNQGAEIDLMPSENGAGKLVYYLPGSVIDEVNNRGKVLTATDAETGMKVILSKGSIDFTYDETIYSVKNDIGKHVYGDYALRLTVTFQQINDVIDGFDVFGKQVTVTLECVAVSTSLTEWDKAVAARYKELIGGNLFSEADKKTLSDMIRNGSQNTELVKYADGIYARAKASLQQETRAMLSAITAKTYGMSGFAAPVMIVSQPTPENGTVRGYTKIGGKWSPTDTLTYGNGKAIRTAEQGVFAFAAGIVNLPGTENILGNSVFTPIIAKYALEDYLGKGAAFSLTDNVTLYAVAGIVARVAGAQKTADPVKYLNGMGYTVSARNSQSATKEETLYLFMALYEIKTGTKAEQMKITNLNKTAQITNLDKKYVPYVRAAYQIGLYEDTRMNAKQNFTNEDVLGILLKLNGKIKL
ncbi:hypothetical protein FACS189490_04550 [Clostridia bacterium]|nr:hypothetical protein FACS189490_04550 [Clostridia bacterium]